MVLTVANKKGGVGKTTTAVVFSSILAQRGKKVLLIDVDPQGNASTASGAVAGAMGTFELLEGKEDPVDLVQQAAAGYDFIAADPTLNKHVNSLPEAGRDMLLKRAIRDIRDKYDYIIIDTPPEMGVFTIAALCAADEVLITMRASRFSTDGMAELWANIKQIRDIYDLQVKVNGILLNCTDERTNMYKQIMPVLSSMAEKMQTKVYKTIIRRDIKIEESQLMQEDITTYAADSRISQDYGAAIDEFLKGEQENG